MTGKPAISLVVSMKTSRSMRVEFQKESRAVGPKAESFLLQTIGKGVRNRAPFFALDGGEKFSESDSKGAPPS